MTRYGTNLSRRECSACIYSFYIPLFFIEPFSVVLPYCFRSTPCTRIVQTRIFLCGSPMYGTTGIVQLTFVVVVGILTLDKRRVVAHDPKRPERRTQIVEKFRCSVVQQSICFCVWGEELIHTRFISTFGVHV